MTGTLRSSSCYRVRQRRVAGALALAAAAACVACSGGSGTPSGNPSGAIQLHEGDVVGQAVFPSGDTAQGGQGSALDSISCDAGPINYHIHVHLSLFVNGQQIAIPPGIGIPGGTPQNGFVFSGTCFYHLHTHDATGIIHVEAPTATAYTLGDFFDIWGQPLSTTNVAGNQGQVTTFVNGVEYFNPDLNPRDIPLAPFEEITLEVGTPVVTPPTYLFPAGY